MINKHHRKTAAVVLVIASLSLLGGQNPAPSDVSSHRHLSSFDNLGTGRLHQAIRTLGTQRRVVLLVDTDSTLSADLLIPDNVSLVHLGAADINLAGHNLMVKGSFSAAPTRVFTGAGTVRFAPGSVTRVVPQWWGANTADNVQRALTAAALCGAELFLPAGNYRFDSTVEWLFTDSDFDARGLTVRGDGPGRTVIQNHTAGRPSFFFGTQVALTDFGWFLRIEGLELTSPNGTGSSGIEIEDVWTGRINNCLVRGHALDGIVMRADLNDFGLPKTWTIEHSLIVKNGRYGINLAAPGSATVAYNIRLDHLDIELNGMGGIFAAAELSQITHSIIANNGTNSASHGGIYMTGITGYRVYENVIADNGFEANAPFDIYADRVANLTIARNDHARIQNTGGFSQEQFLRLDGPQGAFHVIVEHNHFGSGLGGPFTAVLGGPGLESIDLDNNRFNLPAGNTKVSLASSTKSTRRTLGDTVLTNQTIEFADSATGTGDVLLRRGGPGILHVDVASTLQSISSSGGQLQFDCSKGLTMLHSLTENTTVQIPAHPVPGAVINFSIFQPPATAHTVAFDPIFKVSGPFTASGLHFSTIRFVYTGLYWVQLGAAAIDAPL